MLYINKRKRATEKERVEEGRRHIDWRILED